jgi:DNA-binding response OmpR family regulator
MSKLKVLVVDDMSSVRKFTRYGLEKNHPNLEIDEAANGKEAQQILEDKHYDLILCDWEMPIMKGDELLEWVRKHPKLKDIPVIMITAKSEKDDVVTAIHLGVNGYIVKPFTIEALLQKMASVDRRFDRRAFERVEISGDITLQFGDKVSRGSLIDVSMGGGLGMFSVKMPLPQILEKVIVDVKLDKGSKSAGLDGFVLRVQAAEAFMDSENIKIAVKFLDLSADKTKELKKLINSISGVN